MHEITKPIQRGWLRQFLGKSFFILKRKWHWYTSGQKYASISKTTTCLYTVFKHQSLILRPLKDVDMYLQHNKRTNLQLAIQHLDGVCISANTCFSLWKLVGRPTAKKGYLQGLVLKQGKIDTGIGGGLCQLGNLLFWIFAHSPLTITERYRHGFDVFPDVNRKVPFGAGATLAYNYIDLQVKNTTTNTFTLHLWLDKTHLHGELRAKTPLQETYSVVEKNHQIKQQSWGGYSRHNQIFKRITSSQTQTEQLLVENHAIMMYNPFLSDTTKTSQ